MKSIKRLGFVGMALSLLVTAPVLVAASVASEGTMTAVAGGGVSSQIHMAGDGDWTFDLVGITSHVRKVTVAVRLESCSGPVHDYRELSKPSVGSRFTIPSVPMGRHCARASAEGQTGASAEFGVNHPQPPAPGTTLILRPAWPQPFHLGTPRWPLWVSAAVVGTGEDYDASTAGLDWYDCQSGSCTLAAANMPEGYLSLSVSTHTLIASLSAPGTGSQGEYMVIVHQELKVTLGTITVTGSYAYVPVSVTDNGVGIQTRLEPRVINWDEGIIMQKDSTTDANGNANLALKIYKPGSYRVEVHAMTQDGWRYGIGTGTFTK